jgi:hypothetical protein
MCFPNRPAGKSRKLGVAPLQKRTYRGAKLQPAMSAMMVANCPFLKRATESLVVLADNPLREPLLVAGQHQLGGGVAGSVKHPLTEPEQALDRRQRAGAGDGCQSSFNQECAKFWRSPKFMIAKGLDTYARSRAASRPVALPGMRAALAFEPEFDDVRIAGRYHNPPYGLLFAVVTLIPRVRRNRKREFLTIITQRTGRIVGLRPFFMGPTKQRGGALPLVSTSANFTGSRAANRLRH